MLPEIMLLSGFPWLPERRMGRDGALDEEANSNISCGKRAWAFSFLQVTPESLFLFEFGHPDVAGPLAQVKYHSVFRYAKS